MKYLRRFLAVSLIAVALCVVKTESLEAAFESKIVKLTTEDGILIEGRHYLTGHKKVILIAPGISQHKDAKVFKGISESLLSDYDVFTLDFRGHGKSEGRFTLTATETLDLKCALEYLKPHYQKIGVIGFSLGAASAIVVTAQSDQINSLVAVSAPTSFWKISFQLWRKEAFFNLIDNLTPEGRKKSVRYGNPFLKKPKPIDWVEKIDDTPILFIHGTNDWIVRPNHSEKLYALAGGKKELRIVKKGLHAEKIFEQFPNEFTQWVLDWFKETL